ncbi:hypothetical protein Bca52824_077669 [Brassica carinata]|uniref:Prolamin-like domain-containing protein n=1 Tax=Brassica carinata TaxID=52824 RepID=A0A8X7TXH2_BRACI|nr:hypothetical protein Bca52824_077669 [Brassica carinata]
METKNFFMAFFVITTLVSSAYPSLGQEDVDDELLINPGHEFDTFMNTESPASRDYDNNILKNISPKYKHYLETYVCKMAPIAKCVIDVIKEILTNEPGSRECCLEVVRAGKECYMEINKFMFRLYKLKRFSSKVSFKINDVWNRCSAEVESPSSSHYGTIKLS